LSERLSNLKKSNEEIIKIEVRDQTEDMVEVENHNSINKIDRKFNAMEESEKKFKKAFPTEQECIAEENVSLKYILKTNYRRYRSCWGRLTKKDLDYG
jgi:hypothetical protein